MVGDSTGQNASNTYPTPYGGQFEGMRAQYLYTAADLTAAGLSAGNITSLGFKVVSVNGVGPLDNYTIKLGLTNATTLTGFLATTATVFGPVTYQAIAGLNTHPFSTPFFWNGTSNLVIEICHVQNNLQGNTTTNNAIVQQTVGFANQVSLTYRAPNDPNICINSSISNTQEMRRPRLWLTQCKAPLNPVLVSRTSNSANLAWSAPVSGMPDLYEWVYGTANFVPGGGGTQLGSGSGSGLTTTLTNLNGNTAYSFYVRSRCGGSYSAWSGPVQFITEASCGDPVADTDAGLLGNYDTSENYVRVFCPDLAGNALALHFSLFSAGPGDTLRIYNGDNVNAPALGTLTGVYLPSLPPGPFTSTTSTGCLTIQFKSDTSASPLDVGWVANLTCAGLPADSCYQVLDLKASAITYITAQISFVKMFGATSYTYRLVETGTPPILEDSATTTNNVLMFNSLTAGTNYYFVVRGNCINGENSVWDTVFFHTPVNCEALPGGQPNVITCDAPVQVTASGTGIWNIPGCAGNSPGKERIFRFTAPNTRTFRFTITQASNANQYVQYYYKAVKLGCNPGDWNCFGLFNAVNDTASIGPLTAGVEYYILADPQTTTSVFQQFRITGCGPLNDTPENAIELALDVDCSSNVYSNQGATISPGEPNPDTVATDGVKGRWTEPAQNTVWFSFVAPPSQTVTISTNKISINSNGDTQIALYQVDDPADYATFTLLESDEDNGTGFNSNFTYTGLEEGGTYYLQVDSWGINAEGPFCIEVNDDAVRQTNDACSTYFVTNVQGSEWINIYTSPGISDIGKIVLAINPMGQKLDTIFASIQTFPTIPFSGNQIPYLPAYFRLRSSIPLPGPIDVRLFFYDSELDALVDTTNLTTNNTASDLVVSQYSGANTDCNQLNNIGPSNLIPGVEAIQMLNSFYLEFTTSVLGEFAAHFGPLALPLELLSFTGKIAGRENLLTWTTKTEKNVQWHVVERATDGAHWVEIGRLPGAMDSKTTITYSLTDAQPLPNAYYRLRSVDMDGTASVSNSIRLVRPERQFAITEVLPNPVADQLTVRFHTPVEEQVSFQVIDFTGRVMLEHRTDSQQGMNSTVLPLGSLPAGMYQILLTNGTEIAAPMRVVKQ